MVERLSFNASVKKPDGYKKPEGSIVSWNDLSNMVSKNWEFYKTISVTKSDNFGDIEQEDGYLVIRNDYSREKFTPVGWAFSELSKSFNRGITDGRISLFQRQADKTYELPKDLRHENARGYLISIYEIREELENMAYVWDDNDYMLKGIRQFQNFLRDAERDLVDYSDIDIEPVNNPVPKHKLKNTIQERLKQKPKSVLLSKDLN